MKIYKFRRKYLALVLVLVMTVSLMLPSIVVASNMEGAVNGEMSGGLINGEAPEGFRDAPPVGGIEDERDKGEIGEVIEQVIDEEIDGEIEKIGDGTGEDEIEELEDLKEDGVKNIILAELPLEIKWQSVAHGTARTQLNLPDSLATITGQEAVKVTWETDGDYAGEMGIYIFTPALPAGYTLISEIPEILVVVRGTEQSKQVRGMMGIMAMGGGAFASDPFLISTAAQLKAIGDLVNAGQLETMFLGTTNGQVHLQLANDIDLSAYGKNYDGGKGWIPIGTLSKSFAGVFDGGNHKITGLYINRPQDGAYYHALFGYIYGGSVRNLGLPGVDIAGYNTVGGMAGMLDGGGKIENCYVTGTIKGLSTVGGIVGQGSGDIDKCFADVIVTATVDMAGGIAGGVTNGYKISNCYSAGSVNTPTNGGGIVGFASGAVENCYSLATVIGSSQRIGGIAGYIGENSSIKNCAALNPKVSGKSSVGRIGGVNHGTGNLNDNVAFDAMAVLVNGNSQTITGSATGLDGASKTAAEIKAADFFSSLFGSTNAAWTYATDKLPILAGLPAGVQDATMPVHIKDSGVAYFNGAGISGNPYEITTPAQLAMLAELVNSDDPATRNAYNSKEYKLMKDLDLSAYGKNYDGGKGWIPIGTLSKSFEGVFDGGGYVITGLYINRPNGYYQGLFGMINNGTLKSLGIINANVTGNAVVGSLVGNLRSSGNESASIENCYATGNITATNGSNAGGLAGIVIGTVNNCFFSGTVAAQVYVGGIAGDLANPGSLIENCYTNALVIGTGENVGGVAGRINMGAVKNCYAMSEVEGTSNIGGIAGGAYGTVSNCAALNPKVSGTSDVGRIGGVNFGANNLVNNVAFDGMTVLANGSPKGITSNANGLDGESKTAADIKAEDFFSSLFGSTNAAWTYETGKLPILEGSFAEVQSNTLPGYISGEYFAGGDGSEESPYQITTPAQLAKLAELVNNDNETIRNAYNSKEYKLMNDLDLSAYGKNYDNGEGWLPIGINGNNSFNGVFDGNNHKITGLYINRPNGDYQGLFGVTKQGSLKSLGIINANVTGSSSVGSLVGSSNISARIENCYATGNITATNGSNAGGLVGSIIGTVKNSFFSGTVTGKKDVGGIVGDLANSGSLIENCYTVALVTGTDQVGGVVGRINMGTVKNCYAMSRVEGGSKVGGIAGRAYGTVSNCAALNPKVSGTSDVGRLVGSFSDGTDRTLSNNWAFEAMPVFIGGNPKTISSDAKGIDGADLSSALLFRDNFWTDTNNWATAWDRDIWAFAAGQLPTLKGIAEQNGSPDLHLIQFSTSPLTITLEGEGISGSGDNYSMTAKDREQLVTVKVKGWENWIDTRVEIKAMGSTLPSSVNGKATGAVPANFLGNITISASSESNPYNKKEITLSVNKTSGGGGDGGGGSGSGGTSSPTTPATPTETPPTVTENTIAAAATTTVTTTVTTTTNAQGQTSASVTESQVNAAMDAAKQTLASPEAAIRIEIKAGAPATTENIALALPPAAIQTIASEDKAELAITSPVATITFNNQALDVIAAAASEEVTINVVIIPTSSLPDEVQSLVGNRPVYDFTVSSGNTTISDFGAGNAEVAIPYTPQPGENINAIIVYYLNDKGELETITDGYYDSESGTVIFNTNHFSAYIIGYNLKTFSDVNKEAWHYTAISFIAARNITSGSGAGKFSPDANLTRGQFIVMLMKAYNIAPTAKGTNNFTDAGNTYYTDYLAAAKELGIASGIGNNLFAPENAITRQEMFSLLYKALKTQNKSPHKTLTKTITEFSDSDKVAPYATEALNYFISSGAVKGSNQMLLPEKSSTRAEMAQLIYSLLKR